MVNKYKHLAPKKGPSREPVWKMRTCGLKRRHGTKDEAENYAKLHGYNQKAYSCRVCKGFHLRTVKDKTDE